MTELTGSAAKQAERRFRWLWVGAAADLVVLATAWLAWHATYDQLTFLGLGMAALLSAALVARDGAIGVSFFRSGRSETVTVKPAPLPRVLLAPLLGAAGVGLILAATATRVGSMLAVVAHIALTAWSAAQAAWSLFLMLGLAVSAVVALRSRENRVAGVVWLGLLVLVNGGAYLIAPEWFRSTWSTFLEPFREIWGLMSRI